MTGNHMYQVEQMWIYFLQAMISYANNVEFYFQVSKIAITKNYFLNVIVIESSPHNSSIEHKHYHALTLQVLWVYNMIDTKRFIILS